MSKQLFVDPNIARAPGKIAFTDIPVNTYQKKVADEVGNFYRRPVQEHLSRHARAARV